MNWPWVTRGRFEDMKSRAEKLEQENTELLDRLILALSGKPLHSVTAPAATHDPTPIPAARSPKKPSDIARMCTEHFTLKAKEVQVLSSEGVSHG